jgi:hypothetical protein
MIFHTKTPPSPRVKDHLLACERHPFTPLRAFLSHDERPSFTSSSSVFHHFVAYLSAFYPNHVFFLKIYVDSIGEFDLTFERFIKLNSSRQVDE